MSSPKESPRQASRRSLSRRELCVLSAAGALAVPQHAASAQQEKPLTTLILRADKASYRNTPVIVILPPAAGRALALKGSEVCGLFAEDGTQTFGRLDRQGDTVRLTFLLAELPHKETRRYALRPYPAGKPPLSGKELHTNVSADGSNLALFAGTLTAPFGHFTTYTTQSGPNKPFFFPILLDSKHLTRRWPMEEIENESRDHPHHRGLWFTHGSVNGHDFWMETGPQAAKTVHTKFENLHSGLMCGGFRAHTDWITPEGQTIARDVRDVRFYPLPSGDRLMDFEITLTPVGGPLTFGDTKEGMFGLRVHEALAPKPDKALKIQPTGKMVNSNGEKDGDAWGKKAEWVDYSGPIDGKTYGVAIFDHPANLRHPQTWHARDYGLFCVNPFGLHDFKQGEEGAGKHVVPSDEKFTLRYRLLFHHGDTEAAQVAAQCAAYAAPPTISVR